MPRGIKTGAKYGEQSEKHKRLKVACKYFNLLQKHADGEIAIPPDRLRSIEIILRKTMPDLKAVEMSGQVQAVAQVKVEFVNAGD